MLTTRNLMEFYAERIEIAYWRRRGQHRKSLVSSRVWMDAAETLLSVHESELEITPDPELYVASQKMPTAHPDPWSELVGYAAVRRYRSRINAMIRGLRRELNSEVRYAEKRIESGESAASVLHSKTNRISPLGGYIVAHRLSLGALADQFLDEANEQHHSCPLYRPAS